MCGCALPRGECLPLSRHSLEGYFCQGLTLVPPHPISPGAGATWGRPPQPSPRCSCSPSNDQTAQTPQTHTHTHTHTQTSSELNTEVTDKVRENSVPSTLSPSLP